MVKSLTVNKPQVAANSETLLQHKTAMIDILIAHHLSIVADLESGNSEQTRKECFKYIDEAIDIFMRVRALAKGLLVEIWVVTSECQSNET